MQPGAMPPPAPAGAPPAPPPPGDPSQMMPPGPPPLTAPMSDPPPMPLPANPRMSPGQRPMTPEQMQHQEHLSDLLGSAAQPHHDNTTEQIHSRGMGMCAKMELDWLTNSKRTFYNVALP